jgi:hypothetical protein
MHFSRRCAAKRQVNPSGTKQDAEKLISTEFWVGTRIAGAEARVHSAGFLGPTKVVPLLVSSLRLSFSAICNPPNHFVGGAARANSRPDTKQCAGRVVQPALAWLRGKRSSSVFVPALRGGWSLVVSLPTVPPAPSRARRFRVYRGLTSSGPSGTWHAATTSLVNATCIGGAL